MSASYDDSLWGVTRKLSTAQDRHQVKAIVETLVKSTHEMREANKALEERLTLSKSEISNPPSAAAATVSSANLTRNTPTKSKARWRDDSKNSHRHSGSRAMRASPESITTIGDYGFRACALRSAIADRRRIPE
jgi:hypothetical protein